MRMQVRSLALLSGLRIWCCHELCYRLQTWLRSQVAVAVAQTDIYSSYYTPNLGTSICGWCSSKTKAKKIFQGLSCSQPWRMAQQVTWQAHFWELALQDGLWWPAVMVSPGNLLEMRILSHPLDLLNQDLESNKMAGWSRCSFKSGNLAWDC